MGIYDHWIYYSSIESDLLTTSKYIEFTEDNECCYSLELGKIITNSCIEIEHLLKSVCIELTGKNINRFKNIPTWHEPIKEHLSSFFDLELSNILMGTKSKPWHSWTDEKRPQWWKGYTDIKHNRIANIYQANLRNALDAGAALLVATIFFEYCHNNKKNILIPGSLLPKLFMPPGSFGMALGDNSLYLYDLNQT